MLLKNRRDAGVLLAERIRPHIRAPFLLVGLARGGVAVAAGVAGELASPFDVLVVKKLGSPHNPEFAIGALAPDKVSVIHRRDAEKSGMDSVHIEREIELLSDDIKRGMQRYRKGKKPLAISGKTVVLIDDGVATGASMEAAVVWARKKHAATIIVAVPVASAPAAATLRGKADVFLSLSIEHTFGAVGEYYEAFPQVTDEEVIQLLRG